MATQRSVFLLLACLLSVTLLPSPALAMGPADTSSTSSLAVGLLSARDEKPMAVVGPFLSGDRLSLTLVPFNGATTRRVVSGDVFLGLQPGGDNADNGAWARGGGSDRANPFSVQAGSYGSEEAADRFATEVRGHWPDTEVWVTEALLGDGKVAYRVLAGRFPDRTLALAFTTTLAGYGMDGAFVVETGRRSAGDGGGVERGRPLVLYSQATGLVEGLERVTFTAVAAASNSGGALPPAFRLDGSPYRGILEVRGGAAGIIAVNQVELEDYLLGVVPCELGPDRFPLLEALKAQAVTARTYALKHVGRHRAEGFDLCDTPHCQVYGGAGREKTLSTQAVVETAGLAAFHRGKLAETLYTSTCGGRTEISSAVFSGPAEAYLGGVSCTTDHRGEALSIPHKLILQDPKLIETESGADLGLVLGLLTGLDILRPGELSGADVAGAITAAEANQWIVRFCSRYLPSRLLPDEYGVQVSERLVSRCELADLVCAALGWEQRLETLFSRADLLDIVGENTGCGDRGQKALACLLSINIFHLLPDGRPAADATESRGRFASALARLAEHFDPQLFKEGVIAGAGQGTLSLRFGAEVVQSVIAPEGVRLFERRGDTTRPVPFGRYHSGDRVLVHFDQHGQVDLLVRRPSASGAAADRYSPYALWSIVVDRETIEGLLEEKGHRLGRLIDVQPLERGTSGRLTRLRVVGSDGNTVLRGLDIRWNLGTRENLFFIDRMKNSDGLIHAYRFTGRGWGHGVGMCQVGAAGLAETGASFIEILEHYYPGIRIEPAGGTSRRP